MQLNQFRIGQRLGIGFGILALLLVAIVALAYVRLVGTQDRLDLVVELQRRASVAEQWRALTHLNASRAIAIAKSGNQAEVAAYFDPLVKATSAEINGLQETLEKQVDSARGKTLLAEIATRRQAYLDARKDVLTALKAGETERGNQLLNSAMLPAADVYVKAIESIAAYQRERVSESLVQTEAEVTRTEAMLLVLLLACLGVAGGAAWSLTRSVTSPLRDALAATEAIADGDLTRTMLVDGRDEVSALLRGLQRMQTQLRQVVGQIRSGTDSIGTASNEVALGSQDLSGRTEQTASNLQQTASSMEQITATVKQSSDAASQANQLAASATAVARRGGSVVSEVVSTMNEINTSSKRIADIIGTIDGIAFQTNILALNAAVEAARAGEQGRGFAVVAGEVRSLAQRSAEAAREIKSLIGTSVEKVETGSRLVGDAGATMTEIVASVQRVSDIIGEISAAAAEQSSGIGQVNTAVSELDRMTQQNAALVEESAAAAESLKDQAHRLSDAVSVFRTA